PIYDRVFSFDRGNEESSSRTLAIADFDGDGDQDVYIPRKEGSNWLFENQTLTLSGDGIVYNENPDPLFLEVSAQYNVDDSQIIPSGSTGYGAAWGDYDNDEDMDLYLSNWGRNRLFRNDNGTFTNTAVEFELQSDSLSNGAAWGDFDNNGNLDIWAANFKREDDVFLNAGDESPWDNSFRPYFASATQDVVPADYNNDGWLDMFTPGLEMAHGAGPTEQVNVFTSLLFKNITTDSIVSSNHWLVVNLEGSNGSIENEGWTTKGNRSAIGARVILHLTNGSIMREVIAGKGHGSMDPLQLHFGLGDNSTIDRITIRWPSMNAETQQPKVDIFEGPFYADTWLTIVEDLGFVGAKGDINEDDFINILDIVIIVNEIVHETHNFEPELFWAANWDYNGVLNILDVIKMVNFVLNH
ncbi:MAG: FG-GAP-like repeat-containing protein, partial [Candidatus Marinimicrobia bacterium]|nr:FG-GAP-like repeat-containing protein [Candidatus Neomarinimicrobiota bacterium]